MKKYWIVLAALLVFQSPAFAHEGHDATPGAIQAPHGGVVQGTAELYLELVNEASGIKLYPLTHDLKPIPLKEVKVEAFAQRPRVTA